MRVAILAPMPMELRPLVAPLGLVRTGSARQARFHGALGALEITAALTGVGLGAAATCANRLLDEAAPDHLVVVGVAGGLGGSVAVGNLVVPERVLNLDTGDFFAPTPLAGSHARGILASSDELLASPAAAQKLAAQGIVAIDMETAAIAACCQQRGCPWSVFRGISDRADDGATDSAVLGLLNADGSPNLSAVLRLVLSQPWRMAQLVRLARGSGAASRAAANAAVVALEAWRRGRE